MSNKIILVLSLIVCGLANPLAADNMQIKSVVIEGAKIAEIDSPYIVKMNDENFDEIIVDGIVVVDFYASWCQPCRMLGPVFAKVAEEMHDTVTFGKVNVDDASVLLDMNDVYSIPTIIIFNDGKEVKRTVGYMNADALRKFILSAI